MEIVHTETNRGNKAIIVDGLLYRRKNVLKNGDIVYICSAGKNCTMSITTDGEGLAVTKIRNEHTCTTEASDQKAEAHQLRVRVRKQSGDISRRPAAIIRTELQNMEESSLLPKDVKNAALSLYRERRKDLPALPKSRDEAHDAIELLNIETNKSENFLLVNDKDSGIVIFSTLTNLQCLCNDVKELFIDGTFKCSPKHFFQLYSVHGCRNGNYVPLVFALLPSKNEQIYRKMWSLLLDCCSARNLNLEPDVMHIDFEKGMHNAVMFSFPETRIDCCAFHLGQSWWRKLQSLGLSKAYKDKSTEEGKWLSKFFGLSFLPPEDVEDSFIEDIMSDAPQNEKCSQFADYVLEGYITSTSTYPPVMWASVPDLTNKRTNNGPESFHANFNSQFHSSHPNVFLFIDVIKKIQTATYIKIRSLYVPVLPRRCEMEKLQFSVQQYNEYASGSKTRLDYIKCLGYRFGAVTDI